jgi:hypothetical protein
MTLRPQTAVRFIHLGNQASIPVAERPGAVADGWTKNRGFDVGLHRHRNT